MNLDAVIQFIEGWVRQHPGSSKDEVREAVRKQYSLTRRGKNSALLSNADFAICFCESQGKKSETGGVTSIRGIRANDERPILVCVVLPDGPRFRLANTTFIDKVSHSSKKIAIDKARGTINLNNVMTEHSGIRNELAAFPRLWAIHLNASREEEWARIVRHTKAIRGRVRVWIPIEREKETILKAADLTVATVGTSEYRKVRDELRTMVAEKTSDLLKAAVGSGQKKRGTAIELVLSEQPSRNKLHDLVREAGPTQLLIDIKSKLAGKSSAPKAYHIDKALRAMSEGAVVAMLVVEVDVEKKAVQSQLVSILDNRIVAISRVQTHWSGVETRGHIQFSGSLDFLFDPAFQDKIDIDGSVRFLTDLLHMNTFVES